MPGVVFVGDEVTASGYRLCGVRVLSPPLDQAAAAVRQVLGTAPMLLLVTARYAAAVPQAELEWALLVQRPPLLLVDDFGGQTVMPDLAGEIRRQLGLVDPA
ncbi:MAG: hypothetical protein KGJ55_01240 [Gammaproteobacteria bacterium]|nr:hypothetical protein [Gammaproteobacteria bacterium]